MKPKCCTRLLPNIFNVSNGISTDPLKMYVHWLWYVVTPDITWVFIAMANYIIQIASWNTTQCNATNTNTTFKPNPIFTLLKGLSLWKCPMPLREHCRAWLGMLNISGDLFLVIIVSASEKVFCFCCADFYISTLILLSVRSVFFARANVSFKKKDHFVQHVV